MRKYVKILLILFMAFSFTIVYADNSELNIDDVNQIKAQESAIEDYCSEGKEVKGCLFDKSDKLYSESTSDSEKKRFQRGAAGKDGVGAVYFSFPEGTELNRGYQAFSGYGYGVFAGCYIYDVKEETPSQGAGRYFLIEIIEVTGPNKCGVTKTTLIPAQGVKKYERDLSGTLHEKGTYNGTESFEGPVMAEFNDWVAKNDGKCPGVFGYTANTKWYTKDSNTYIFSDNEDAFHLDTFSFSGNVPYKVRPGCMVEDKWGKEKVDAYLAEKVGYINNNNCPSKIEDMNSYQDKFDKWYDEINNEVNELYSRGLLVEVNKNTIKTEIQKAISKKITDCQYLICGVNNEKRKEIESKMGNECKNGCSLKVVLPQADSPNAVCNCCETGLPSCVLQWTDNPIGNCQILTGVSKDQCIGTEEDLYCRRCLINAISSVHLKDEKKSCLIGNEIAKELTESNLESKNREAANREVEEQVQRNREKREEIYENLSGGIRYDFNIPSGDLTGCSNILGKNLTALVKASITILQIIAAIIAILKGMMTLIPPIIAHDADALKKASKTLITMAIILVIIFLFKPLLRFIGSIVDFDTSCIL